MKRSEVLTAFANDVRRQKVSASSAAAAAVPPPANETQPQKKLLSSFIAAATTAAASATLPHWERPQSPAHSQTKRLLLASTMQLNKYLENAIYCSCKTQEPPDHMSTSLPPIPWISSKTLHTND